MMKKEPLPNTESKRQRIACRLSIKYLNHAEKNKYILFFNLKSFLSIICKHILFLLKCPET